MREAVKPTTESTEEDTFKYRYGKYDKKERNFKEKKPATIFQIVATTEMSTNLYYKTPPSYKHYESSSTTQTESYFFSSRCNNPVKANDFLTLIFLVLFLVQ